MRIYPSSTVTAYLNGSVRKVAEADGFTCRDFLDLWGPSDTKAVRELRKWLTCDKTDPGVAQKAYFCVNLNTSKMLCVMTKSTRRHSTDVDWDIIPNAFNKIELEEDAIIIFP